MADTSQHTAPEATLSSIIGARDSGHDIRAEVKTYLRKVMAKFAVTKDGQVSGRKKPDDLPDQIFATLTSREFSYLSKSRAARYREPIVDYFERASRGGKPLAFYYDIGGGYHATVRPGDANLVFDVGLAEVFALAQIASFNRKVQTQYDLGIKFSFVIDNLCALLINDVPVSRTSGYCSQLRHLIQDLGMSEWVDVLVESEIFDTAEYRVASNVAHAQRDTISDKELENVERFLGRRCDKAEALERIVRYQHVTGVSERLFGGIIDGVHMTQRASPTTIAFRPFPGGDSRIQTGEVAITRNTNNKLHPVLMTSENIDSYHCESHRIPDILPSVIRRISYAEPRIS